MKRRSSNISFQASRAIIQREIEGPNSLVGYRGMWNHLKRSYGIRITRDTIMTLMQEIDPQGIELRRARRLTRREYRSPGPNHCWHIDGYDKLKPYGLRMHGCIDGFSRKILWLKVVRSNNNPIFPPFDYLSTVRKYLRTDCGTENGISTEIQCFFRQNEKAHIYGTSTANQQIECWWSNCKKSFFCLGY